MKPSTSRTIRISQAVVSVTLLVAFGFSEAQASQVSPVWASKNASMKYQNNSYLVGTEVRRAETINDELFDAGTSQAFRKEYESSVESDEAAANAGLNGDSRIEKSRFERMKDMARRAVDSFSKLRLKLEGDKIKKAAENSSAREPMAAVVLAASLYTGRAMSFKVMEGIRMSSHAALKNREASLSMHLLTTGLSSTVAYNPQDMMSAQLSQKISGPVSAVVGTSQTQKGSAQVVYSVSF